VPDLMEPLCESKLDDAGPETQCASRAGRPNGLFAKEFRPIKLSGYEITRRAGRRGQGGL